MSYTKLDEVETPVGIVKVGSKVKLNFDPQFVENHEGPCNVQRIFAIYKDEYGNISFAFDEEGVNDERNTWNGSGQIETDVIAILETKINNWKEELRK